MNIETPDYNEIYAECSDAEERARLAIAEWERLHSHMSELGLFTQLRVRLLDRLVREYVEYEMAYPEIAAKGSTFIGPNGGEVFSLAWSALAKTKAEILKLEEVLKITPQKAATTQPQKQKILPSDRYLDPDAWTKHHAELEKS